MLEGVRGDHRDRDGQLRRLVEDECLRSISEQLDLRRLSCLERIVGREAISSALWVKRTDVKLGAGLRLQQDGRSLRDCSWRCVGVVENAVNGTNRVPVHLCYRKLHRKYRLHIARIDVEIARSGLDPDRSRVQRGI